MIIEAVYSQKNNVHGEDAFILDSDSSLFGVADGVTGMAYGVKTLPDSADIADASLKYLSDYVEYYRSGIEDEFNPENALRYVSQEIKKLGALGFHGATTLCAGIFEKDGSAVIINPGDSMAIVYDEGRQVLRTTDHTIEDARGIPVLGSYISSTGGLEVYATVPLHYKVKPLDNTVKNRTVLFMTDGITGSVPRYEKIRQIVCDDTLTLQGIADSIVNSVSTRYDDKTVVAYRMTW